jgi:tyrosine-protein kinase Etk/Wzc
MSELQGPPSAEPAAEPVQDDTFTVLDLVLVLVRRRRIIVATTGIAAVVLLGYNILAMVIDPESRWNLLPTWFTASVTVSIADDGPDYGAGAATLLSRIPDTGGLADFASLLAPGTSTDASRAQELLIGREILDALARQQEFVTDASSNDDIALARERLGKNLDTEYLFESDLLVISYDHYYPDQAAAGLEFAVQRLRAKMHALTIERVRRRKIFLDERLAEVRQDRTEAQDALTEFQQEFGVINLAAQSESAIQNVTALKTELYRKEVELHSQIELLGENTAAVVRLRSAVDQLRTLIREIEHGFVEFQDSAIPLQELPALGVRYLDLATELSVHDTIYAFLRSQYESTRIEENAKESAFQIVEEVEVPLRKSRPSRALICIIGTLAAFMASILAAFAVERFKRAESDPVQRRQLDEIRQEIGFMRKRTGSRT